MGKVKISRGASAAFDTGYVRIPALNKDGSGGMVVRFLEDDPEGTWAKYKQVFSEVHKESLGGRPFPLYEGYQTQPGDEFSNRWLVHVIDVASDKVVVVQIVKAIYDKLKARYDRIGTITERDFLLYKQGEGMTGTSYDADALDKSPKNIKPYFKHMVDIEEILQAEADRAEADIEGFVEDDEDEPAPKRKPAAGPKRKPAAPADDDEDEDDVEEDEEEDDTDEDDDDTDEDDDGDEPDDDLDDKSLAELRALAKAEGLSTRGLNDDDIRALLRENAAEEVEEDETEEEDEDETDDDEGFSSWEEVKALDIPDLKATARAWGATVPRAAKTKADLLKILKPIWDAQE